MDGEEKDPVNKKNTPDLSIQTSSKNISIAFFFSFLRTYGLIPLNIAISWIVSRNMVDGKWAWDMFIFVSTFITAPKILILFIPPSINTVILYKVPEYLSIGRKGTARGLLNYALKIKLLFSIVAMVVFIAIGMGYIATGLEDSIWKGWGIVIFSPNIVLAQLFGIFYSFFNSIKNFHINFSMMLLENILVVVGYILLFYVVDPPSFGLKFIWMLLINLFKKIPSLIVVLSAYLSFFKNTSKTKYDWQQIKDSGKFGLYYTTGTSIQMGIDQTYNFLLENSDIDGILVEYNMAKSLTGQTLTAFRFPLSSILTPYYKLGKIDEMEKLLKKTIHFSNLIMSFFIGFMFFLTPSYVIFVFGPDFLEISYIIRIYLFFVYFQKLLSLNSAYLGILEKQKEILINNAIGYIFTAVISTAAFLIWDLQAFLIAQIIGYAFQSFLFTKLINKHLVKKEKFINNYETFIALMIIIGLTLLINEILFQFIPFDKWGVLFYNLFIRITNWEWDLIFYSSYIFRGFGLVIIFVVFYLAYIKIFKSITKKDIKYITEMNMKIPFKKQIKKILIFLS